MSKNSNANENENSSDKNSEKGSNKNSSESSDIESSDNNSGKSSVKRGENNSGKSSENNSENTKENGGESGKGNGKGKGKRSRRMKRKTFIILLSVFGAILIAAAVFVALQWNNITALRTYMTHTKEEIGDKIIDNDQRIAGVLERTTPVKIRDLTEDEKKLMASNSLSIEDAVKLLLDDAITISDDEIAAGAASVGAPGSGTVPAGSAGSASQNAAAANAEANAGTAVGADAAANDADAAANAAAANAAATNDADAAAATEAEERLAALVAEAFVLRAYYTNSLESMRASAVSEYSALNAEDRTQTVKMNIGMNYMNRAGALEGECDRRMDRLVAGIESELKQTGGDTSVIGEIKSCYAEEKSLKKAYYLSLYN